MDAIGGNVPVWFGKGPMEKDQSWYQAFGLFHSATPIGKENTICSRVKVRKDVKGMKTNENKMYVKSF